MLNFISWLLLSTAVAEDISSSETSYTGASILQGDGDVQFDTVTNLDNEEVPDTYAFFEGNTLYVGNSDENGNTVDGIIEFFWFQSSIDRGTDFYVAVIKARTSPGDDCYWAPWLSGYDCHLWADEYQDFGEYPVLSVEAFTDVSREAGAFRWDWSVPFENYGIDAYGQVTFQNQYGIGANAEGSAMAHGEYTIDEDGNIKAAGDVQVKGYASSQYSVQTQYEVTLYEWDVFVDGRANMMAWDMYLNLGARDDQSAYHEYFLAIQVEEGEPFMLDELNLLGNFDTGWWNPFRSELGLSIKALQIHQPEWEEANEDIEEDSDDTGNSELGEEEIIEPAEEETEDIDTGHDGPLGFDDSAHEKVTSGCNAVYTNSSLLFLCTVLGLLLRGRKDD
jgi:hypothetical protein